MPSAQQSIFVVVVVVSIFGVAHQVADLSAVPFRVAETNCHGGTCRLDGFEISSTPVDSFTSSRVEALDFLPNWFTRA